MKIITQDEYTLVTSDKEYKQLFISIAFAIFGVLLFLLGITKHSVESWIFGLLLFGYMMYMAIFNRKQRQLTIDKRSGQVTVITKSIHGPTNNAFAITDINNVLVVRRQRGRGADQLSLYLVLKNGTNVDISDSQQMYGFLRSAASSPAGKIGQQIATYLGLQLDQQTVGALSGFTKPPVNPV